MVSETAWLAEQREGVAASALVPLRESGELISEARRRMAELEEPAALRCLARAEQLLQAALQVPGVSAYYAEVQLQLGVTAAQVGLFGLADASFGRAARLDPRRRLLSGEAAPEVVARAARVFDEAAGAPEGDLRITSEPTGARVFVDDVERGETPLALRARAGTHVLRLELPGERAYGTLFDVAPGLRPAQHFVLVADARAQTLAALRAEQRDVTPFARASEALLAAAPELAALAWSERDVRSARQLVFFCDRSGCRAPWRTFREETLDPEAPQPELTRAELESARGWLRSRAFDLHTQPGASERTASLWGRWYVWTAAALVLAGAGVWVAIAAQPDRQRTLRVSVDPGDLR